MILRTRSFSSSVPFFARTKRKKNRRFSRKSGQVHVEGAFDRLHLFRWCQRRRRHTTETIPSEREASRMSLELIPYWFWTRVDSREGWSCAILPGFSPCVRHQNWFPHGFLKLWGGAAFLFLVKYRTWNDKKHGNYIWKYGRLELSPASSSGTEPGWAASAKSNRP